MMAVGSEEDNIIIATPTAQAGSANGAAECPPSLCSPPWFLWTTVSAFTDLQDLIRGMMALKGDRLTLMQVLEHSWLR